MPNRHCHLVDLSCMSGVRASLALGYLQAYALTDDVVREAFRFHRHVWSLSEPFETLAERVLEAIREAGGADVVGLTTFFWNRALNLGLSARIKREYPHAVIVLGGNEVTNQGEEVLTESLDVDFVVHGEGEVTFRDLLRELASPSPDPSRVAGLSWRGADGTVLTSPPRGRLAELDEIPSPFLTGLLSPAELGDTRTLVYEFSRGCPFRCAFCHWGAAVNTPTRRFSLARIEADLDYIIRNMPRGGTLFLADANFGMVQQDVEIARIMVDLLQRHDKSIYLFANWSKNTTSRVVEAARVLFQGRMIAGVTLSAQSLNEEALRFASRKNIKFDYYRSLQSEFRALGIPT
ncbi:MAG TPA: cobalamin-dependent protein, partial [Longimicrobiaceae bacterium]|nr:cobalamin-dependent protein [Longimicrobiaceae bacterium]